MANMTHCMFENTYNDLEQCYERLSDEGLKGCINNANQYEKPYIIKLIELCQSVTEDFGTLFVHEEEE